MIKWKNKQKNKVEKLTGDNYLAKFRIEQN